MGQRTLASLYDNVNGSRKTISAEYANIDGVSKQIFPYNATITYTWNRYNIVTTSSGPELYNSGSNAFLLTSADVSPCGLYCMQNASFTPYYNSSSGQYRLTITSASAATIKSGFKPSEYFYHDGSPSINTAQGSESYVAKAKSAYYASTDPDYQLCIDVSLYKYRAGSTVSSQGSTSYGTVTSSSRNAYPDNGVSGSYWYVFVG